MEEGRIHTDSSQSLFTVSSFLFLPMSKTMVLCFSARLILVFHLCILCSLNFIVMCYFIPFVDMCLHVWLEIVCLFQLSL